MQNSPFIQTGKGKKKRRRWKCLSDDIMYFFWGEFHLWGVLSLRADDDTLVSHTGRG